MPDSPDGRTAAAPAETARPTPPRARLRHRIPRSLRQHWKWPVAFVVFVLVMATVFGGWKIRPFITGDADVIASEITTNVAGNVDLFDPSVSHELTIDMTDAEYRSMLSSFEKDGSKDWVAADVVIDGTRLDDVAVRLKGNSTLMGLRGRGFGPGGDRTGGGPPGPPGGVDGVPGQAPPGFDPAALDPAALDPAAMERMRKTMTQVSNDDPTSLPLLLSFDEYFDGRAYQGMTELSVRPGSPVVNEATALSVTTQTGQASQRYGYVTYSINGSATASKLVLEHPDASYAESLFDSKGYLYKADANSRLKYVGDDQSDYAEQFVQINSVGNGNLQPVINLARWLDSADDREFAEELDQWVDVKSFARYVATQNLLGNGDDMSGPGQNYYLWYDLESKKLTVVSWDLNLAMNGDPGAGPDDEVSIGPMGGRRGQQPPGAGGPQPAADGKQPAADAMSPPEGAGPGGARPPALRDVKNPLKTRFLAAATEPGGAFVDLYRSTYWELYDQIYADALADSVLDGVAEAVPVTDKLSAGDREEAVESLRSWIANRTAALASQRD